MTSAIQVDSLGKRYRIGDRQRYLTLRDRLGNWLRAPLGMLRGRSNGASNGASNAKAKHIWALRDVSLEIKEGEVVGLIGRNGAGKTTLLKILSRVTQPTTGWAEIRGRVGSLLEVGTGFHAELTGRENVFLNGAILGMGRREIERKFDEIVAFGEVSEFIDTPIKHYSTGMQMRLAFAVAAHFEPQIMLVDEVLAVGDIAFQKKCLGKMDDVAHAGRTIVFVSHQMNQIRRLCQRVIWIDGGGVRADGTAAEIVGAYEAAMSRGGEDRFEQGVSGVHTRFVSWELQSGDGAMSSQLETLGEVKVRFEVKVGTEIRRGHHGVALFDADRQLIWAKAADDLWLPPGLHTLSHTFPSLPLRPGPYFWQVSLWDDGALADLWDCMPEMVIATPSFQHARDEWNGILNIPTEFSVHMKEVGVNDQTIV